MVRFIIECDGDHCNTAQLSRIFVLFSALVYFILNYFINTYNLYYIRKRRGYRLLKRSSKIITAINRSRSYFNRKIVMNTILGITNHHLIRDVFFNITSLSRRTKLKNGQEIPFAVIITYCPTIAVVNGSFTIVIIYYIIHFIYGRAIANNRTLKIAEIKPILHRFPKEEYLQQLWIELSVMSEKIKISSVSFNKAKNFGVLGIIFPGLFIRQTCNIYIWFYIILLHGYIVINNYRLIWFLSII
ncbi:hypothetical protein AGLY_006848 [Aphis glycines]|uniref:Uncharacterized protein n=1 Tax=Aphis glycines TaxID=307491 RepID=A0A6G0TR23_APHGL|nr:hypothetical protein AGLY_006848 [Aphis glycines]